MTNEEKKARRSKELRDRREINQAVSLINPLLDAAHTTDSPEVFVRGLLTAILEEHPTITQGFMRTLHTLMERLAEHPRFGTDLRSEASKEFAKHCAAFDKGFPYV